MASIRNVGKFKARLLAIAMLVALPCVANAQQAAQTAQTSPSQTGISQIAAAQNSIVVDQNSVLGKQLGQSSSSQITQGAQSSLSNFAALPANPQPLDPTATASNPTGVSLQLDTAYLTQLANTPTATLIAKGCDPTVLKQMIADASQKVANLNQAHYGSQVAQPSAGAPDMSSMASCMDSATNVINNAARLYNEVANLLTGNGLDSSQLMSYAKNLLEQKACQEVNTMVAQGGVTNGINGAVNAGQSYVNQGLGTTVGSGSQTLGSVGGLMSAGGMNVNSTTGTGTVGYVNPGSLMSGASKAASGAISGGSSIMNSLNVFK